MSEYEEMRSFYSEFSAPMIATEIDDLVFQVVEDTTNSILNCGPYADPQVDWMYSAMQVMAELNNYASKVWRIVEDGLIDRLVLEGAYEREEPLSYWEVLGLLHGTVAALDLE